MKLLIRREIGFRLALFSIMATTFAFGYNNCQKVAVSESEESVLARINSGAAIFINNDATYTNVKEVSLGLVDNSASEMYITNDPTCQGGGQWEPYATSKPWVLAQENSTAQVYAKFRESDKGLESGCYSDSIIHDNIPPALVIIDKAPAFTNQSVTSVRFSASDALSGIESMTCSSASGGSVSNCQENLSIPNSVEGPAAVTIRARDRAGNMSQPLTESWIYDKTPPKVVLNSTPSAVTNSSLSAFGFSGSDNLSPVLTYECKVDSQSYASCTSPYQANLSQGSHTFSVQARDQAGNVSTPASFAWTIDQTAPTVMITSTPPAVSSSGASNFAFSGSDEGQPLSRYECQIDTGAYASCASPKSYTLAEGSHTFRVRGYDSVGNVSSPASYSWIIDLTAPTVQITSHPPAITKDTLSAFTFTAADSLSGVDYTECSLNNAAFAKCTGSISYSNAVDGQNTFSVRAVDKAGNKSNPAQYTWLVDRVAPTLQIISGPASLTKESTARLVMQVSDNSGVKPTIQCRLDGEAYSVCSETRDYASVTDGPHTFYARATDAAGNVSAEQTYSWTADLMGPAITFTKVPLQTISVYDKAELEFVVTDAISGVDTVSCGLGSASASCPVTKSEVFSNMAAGTYTYVVTAQDKIGNVSTNSVTWKVVDNSKLVNQSVVVNVNNKVDVLIVIDNSGSMAPEQSNMAQRFSTFFDKLTGLDWQLGIITTDVDNNAPLKDGRFLQFSGMTGTYILNSSMDLNAAKTAFSATIQRPANEGSGNEQGIAASYRAVQRSQETTKAESAPNVAFFRPQSALTILVVTDANESNPNGTQTQNVPQNLVNLVQSTFPNKPMTFHSIVVKSGDSACLGQSGNEAYGASYEQLSKLTGGLIGSVCETNYSNQLGAMGQATVDLIKSVTLQCAPLDTNGDGVPDIKVTLSNGGYPPSYTLDGLKLTFATGLPAGTQQLSYQCLK